MGAAREYLEWLERLGIVTPGTGRPAMYRRNQEYLNWRRVQKLRDEYLSKEPVTFWQTKWSDKNPIVSSSMPSHPKAF